MATRGNHGDVSDVTEIRIALVLNGGVSLAVWMGGVVHEIDLLRRASAGILPPPPDSPDRPVYDMWADLCARHSIAVIVDVVAGTSAGGLNGTLLATSIARGAPLPELRTVWRDAAQISQGALVPPGGTGALPSVLDGDYFADEVRGVFDAIVPRGPGSPVTLFVTATALGRHEMRVVDTYGSSFPVPDHRRLFRFSYDPTRRSLATGAPAPGPGVAGPAGSPGSPAAPGEAGQGAGPGSASAGLPQQWVDAHFPTVESGTDGGDFGPVNTPALTRAARASAGFPVAFAPVHEVDEEVDLRPWRIRGNGVAWLVDGGVLDNAPFGPVLDAIAARPVDRPWRRVLAYIVPSGTTRPASEPDTARPGWVPVLLAGLRLPAEADLRGDVDQLTDLGQAAGRWTQQPGELFVRLRSGGADELLDAASALLAVYRTARVNSGVDSALWLWAGAEGNERHITLGEVAEADPDTAAGWVPPADWTSAVTGDTFAWGTAVADRVARLLLRDLGRRRVTGEPLEALSRVVSCITALRVEVERHITSFRPQVSTSALAVAAVNEATQLTGSPHLLSALLQDAVAAYLRGTGAADTEADAVLRDCLAVEVLTRAFHSTRFQRYVKFDMVRMGPDVDSPAVPSVAPNADSEPLPLGEWKLWGTKLGHFGAFGLAQWRNDDWLWGRLDGAAHLVRIISGRLPAAAGATHVEEEVTALQELILRSEATGVEDVRATLRDVMRLTNKEVLDLLRSTDDGRRQALNLAHAVLRTLRSNDEGVPPAITRFGQWLSIVLADDIDRDLKDEFGERVARAAGRLLQGRFIDLVQGEVRIPDNPAHPML